MKTENYQCVLIFKNILWAFTPDLILVSFSVSIRINNHNRQHHIFYIQAPQSQRLRRNTDKQVSFSWSDSSSICSDRGQVSHAYGERNISNAFNHRTPFRWHHLFSRALRVMKPSKRLKNIMEFEGLLCAWYCLVVCCLPWGRGASCG